jgi:hypothetical protein
MYVDCNPNTWQVALVEAGSYVYYSARAAAAILSHEREPQRVQRQTIGRGKLKVKSA